MRRNPFVAGLVASAVLAASVLLAEGGAAAAETFTVDTLADTGDALPGDGLCDDGSGSCSLRAAIEETNATPGLGQVSVPAGTHVISAPLVIDDDLTITGAGASATTFDLDGGPGFDVADRSLSIAGVAIVNGSDVDGGAAVQAAFSDLTLDGVEFSGHVTEGDGAAVQQVGGSLTVSDSRFAMNSAQNGGALIVAYARVEISGSEFVGNTASNDGGAALVSFPVSLTVDSSSFDQNLALGDGGGLLIEGFEGAAATDTISVLGTSFVGNSGDQGGGLFLGPTAGSGGRVPVQITGSLFDANLAVVGGGLAIDFGHADVGATSFSNNSASGGGGGAIASGGELHIDASTFEANRATGSGGAIAANGWTTVSEADFVANSTNGLGGAIALLGSDTPTVTDTTFIDNVAEVGAGAFWRLGSDIDESGTEFLGNVPDGPPTIVAEPTVAEDEPPAVPTDYLELSLRGSYQLEVAGSATAGDVSFDSDARGILSVHGEVTVGATTVSLHLVRVGRSNRYLGWVRTADTQHDLELLTPVLLKRVSPFGESGIQLATSWFTRVGWSWQRYRLTIAVDDLA